MRGAGAVFLVVLVAVTALFLLVDLEAEEPRAATKRPVVPKVVEHDEAELVAGNPKFGAPEPAPTEGSSEEEESTETKRQVVPRGPLRVQLFQHADHDINFPGNRFFLDRGRHVAPADFDNDDASTVRIPEGLKLVLYDAGDFTGARLVLGPGQHNLAPYGFNDRASSAWVLGEHESLAAEMPDSAEKSVVLYESRPGVDEPARSWKLPITGDNTFYSSRKGYFDAFVVSAVWVPTGVELTLFEQPEGRGPALVLGSGFHELATMDFDNKTLSVRMRREE